MSKMGEELEKRLDEAKYDLYEALRDLSFQLEGANIPFSQALFDAKKKARQALAKVKE